METRTSVRCLAGAVLVALTAQLSPPAWAEDTTEATAARPPDPPAGTELVERRTAATKTFATAERGTFRTSTFSGPVHYRDAAGRWAEIDASLSRSPDSRYRPAAGVADSSIAASSASTEVATLRVDATHSVAFALDGGRAVTGTAEGNRMRFASVWDAADVELAVQPGGVKDDIVLHSKDAARDFVFPLRLQGLTAAMEPDGSVAYRDETGAIRARTPAGYMEDAAHASSTAVTYRLVAHGGVGTALEVSLDRAWLDDPARQFPVRVDPSLFVSTDAEDDTYIWFGGGYGAADRAYESTLNVGSNDGANFARAGRVESRWSGSTGGRTVGWARLQHELALPVLSSPTRLGGDAGEPS